MILVTESGEVYLTEGIQDNFTLSESFANLDLQVIDSLS